MAAIHQALIAFCIVVALGSAALVFGIAFAAMLGAIYWPDWPIALVGMPALAFLLVWVVTEG